MNQTLNILHLEDNPADALLVRDLLEHDGIAATIQVISHKAELLDWLGKIKWDLVISDYRLPDFNGFDALKLVREKHPVLPFILTSGTISEAVAIDGLKAGATDYVLKQNRDRLPSAVRRAMAEAAERALRQETQDELRRSEKQYRLLFQGNPHPMWVFDLESLLILEVNEAAIQHYGYSRDEFLRMTLKDLRAGESVGEVRFGTPENHASGLVWRHRRKNGTMVDMEVVWSPLAFHGKLAALTMATDVTTRRRAAQHNAVFGRLSHQLSAATTASEAAVFICEAADELFRRIQRRDLRARLLLAVGPEVGPDLPRGFARLGKRLDAQDRAGDDEHLLEVAPRNRRGGFFAHRATPCCAASSPTCTQPRLMPMRVASGLAHA